MPKIFMRSSLIFSLLVVLIAIFAQEPAHASAATLQSVSDTVTTSRPSAGNTLNADQAASASQVTIVDIGTVNSNTIFLASDSATFRADTGETMDTGLNVSTMSAQTAGTPNTRIVYFTNTVTHTHHKGDAVIVPITAMHTVKFTTVTAVPTLGKITIQFPNLTSGDANTPASPSATTFQLNGLSDTNVKINGLSGAGTFTGTYTNPSAGNPAKIDLALTGTTNIPASTVVTILIGCSANSGASCTTQVPTIINPTKTATPGTADSWQLTLTTRDVTNSIDLDTAKIKIGTIETILVQANIDPTFTFTIAGVADATALNTGGTCGASHNVDTTNTGISTTATVVNLGTLSSTASNSAAQTLNVTSNAVGGYTITATTSGTFINPATGYALLNAQGAVTNNDTPAPATMTTGASGFGIHFCDSNSKVTANTWGQAPDKFANPSATFYYTAVNSGTTPGPSGDTIVALYRATIAGNTPAGTYREFVTYVATAIF